MKCENKYAGRLANEKAIAGYTTNRLKNLSYRNM
jgi:hypothetical protein